VFLATTGCRIGEALALKWDSANLEAGTVIIAENIRRIGNEWVTCKPNTRSGERTITLPPMTVTALRRQKVMLAERRLKAGPNWQESGRVFPGIYGAPVCTSTI
jgi:integrase